MQDDHGFIVSEFVVQEEKTQRWDEQTQTWILEGTGKERLNARIIGISDMTTWVIDGDVLNIQQSQAITTKQDIELVDKYRASDRSNETIELQKAEIMKLSQELVVTQMDKFTPSEKAILKEALSFYLEMLYLSKEEALYTKQVYRHVTNGDEWTPDDPLEEFAEDDDVYPYEAE